jgi:hypothetical protein
MEPPRNRPFHDKNHAFPTSKNDTPPGFFFMFHVTVQAGKSIISIALQQIFP